jgi:hypothetical protein
MVATFAPAVCPSFWLKLAEGLTILSTSPAPKSAPLADI